MAKKIYLTPDLMLCKFGEDVICTSAADNMVQDRIWSELGGGEG